MKKTKVNLLKKCMALSLALLFLNSNVSFAAANWNDLQTEVNTAPSGAEINVGAPMTTNGTALNLGTPPVPITIKGNNNKITAQSVAPNTVSQIMVNSASRTVVIENTNLTGAVGNTGGAIQNAAGTGTSERTVGGDMTIQGTDGNRVEITNNTAGKGGAIYNLGNLTISNVDFSRNQAIDSADLPNNDGTFGRGGVIYNGKEGIDGIMTITNSTFMDNSSSATGSNSSYSGVIHNRVGTINIYNSQFGAEGKGNHAGTSGGAIVNQDLMNIYDSSFSYNYTSTMGGAIVNGLDARDVGSPADSIVTMNNVSFDHNYADLGGAIFNVAGGTAGYKNELNISNGSAFVNNGFKTDTNSVSSNGGAISNQGQSNAAGSTDAILNINTTGTNNRTVVFQGNVARNAGGAIHNTGTTNINNAAFINNGVNEKTPNVITQNGGAIYNTSNGLGGVGNLKVSNSTFQGNTAQYGGAIYNTTTTATITDTNFSGNKAVNAAGVVQADRGGAIYGAANSKTTIVSENQNVNIGDYGTSLENGYDTIKLENNAVLDLASGANTVINLNSTIYGQGQTNVINVNGGNVNVNAPIKNSTISINSGIMKFEHDRYLAGQTNTVDPTALNKLILDGGTLNLLNNEFVDQLRASSLELKSNSSIMLDVDLANEKMDSILGSNFPSVSVTGDSILNIAGMKSVSEAKNGSATILFTDVPELIGHVTSEGSKIIESPRYKYSVSQITQAVPGTGSMTSPGEYFQFSQMGDSDSIIAAPVAAQAAFLMMDNLYRQSFANMDMVSLMTPEQRMAWKMRNKYANNGYHTGVYAPNVIPEERDGWYMRPFTNFESVPMKGGPKVSNVSYGTLIGGESDLVDLGRGWDGNFSIFGAYHGSHQAYNGVGIFQNGGTLGAVGTAYKGNFWTGVTANVGASAAEASTMWGHDNFPILMSGAAWKSGYNWGLLRNKLVIQPSYMMSYTYVNVFDFTNAAGIRVNQDPLNAIEIIPGLRIIGNLKNGWQPYLGFSMTWNIMDKTKFTAADVPLTPLAIKPYFEYGLGLQKRYGDRFTGFGQAMLRSGGRNGIALTMGFRWALGN